MRSVRNLKGCVNVNYNMKRECTYEKIIDVICEVKRLDREELFKILKDTECKYLLFLLLRKYKCADLEKINEDFHKDIKKSIKFNLKKAEEKFFVNKEFRELFFETEDIIDKII